MTTFDWTVLAFVGLSTLLAFFRGVVRELIAVVAWVLGLIGAVAYTPVLGALLPQITGYPAVPYIVAFALIVIGALLLGALIALVVKQVFPAQVKLSFVVIGIGVATVTGLLAGWIPSSQASKLAPVDALRYE